MDETCGFARTSDYWGPQHFPLPFTNSRTQADAITPDTDLVTVTFGGNPSSLDLAASCFPSLLGLNGGLNMYDAGSSFPPQLWVATQAFKEWVKQFNFTCENAQPAIENSTRNFYWDLRNIVEDIKRRAPHAEIRVVGYLDIVGDPDQTCIEMGGFTHKDRVFYEELHRADERCFAAGGAGYRDRLRGASAAYKG